MDIFKAKEIIQQLAEGVDPISGEVLSEDSICNNPEIIRAFYTILHSVTIKKPKKTVKERQEENVKNGKPKNAGFSWDKESKNKVAKMFKSGEKIDSLANIFGRTTVAITSELTHQGLIS